MNKFLLLLLFLFCSNIWAQDTLAVAEKQKIQFTEKDIMVDSAAIEAKTFPKDFRKKYTDTPFIYEFKTPEKNAWDRFKEWLAGLFRDLFNFSTNEAAMDFVGILLKGIAVLIILFVVYLIAKALINKEGQWIFGKKSAKNNVDYSEIEKNLHQVDFEKLIQNTLASGEKRLSIRYYYLWLLKQMAAREWIVWDVEKTNSDYLYELQDQARKDEFAYLSYLYNNIWYGEFELDEATFTKTKKAFEHALKKSKNG